MNNILDTLNTKSKDFENTVSIVTTGAAAGIAISKGINRNQKIGALVGIGVGLAIYTLFAPKSELKKVGKAIGNQIKEIENKFEK
ncbi:hypothetical protein [Faecalibacter bovis]|uniref:YtxH domain-containing protein n=1 Tax=Faecalibacter bovis TaxID=2898187 RepID=A0ABX7XBZ2_9FLAO|nr:hypothetical protein [Faecalibacter bovis]MBS7332788.1 hypothetical protein [Weeksellaceae bacterium]QTV05431.1 hypothetical protein J9309_11750 [Faecalibacter bovis]